MTSMRSEGWVIDTIVSLTLAKWETVSGRFGGYLRSHPDNQIPRGADHWRNRTCQHSDLPPLDEPVNHSPRADLSSKLVGACKHMAGGLLGVPPGPSKARGRRRPQPPTALQIRLRKDSRAFRSSRPNAEKRSVGEGALSAFGGNRPEFRQDVISGAKGEQEFTSRAAESGDIAISFLRLANLDSEIVDRLSP